MKKYLIVLLSFCLFSACSKTTLDVSNTNNLSPVIDSVTVLFDFLAIVPTANIICWAHDPDGDSLSYKWKATAGEFVGSGSSVTYIIAPCCDSITNKITVEVSDPFGAKATHTFSIKAPKY